MTLEPGTMKKFTLRELAPPKPANWRSTGKDPVWLLGLDQIESNTGDIVNKKYGPSAAAGPSTFAFDEGNVLYSKLRPYLNKVIRPREKGVATTELIPLRPIEGAVDPDYLTYYLRSAAFVAFASAAVTGAKMPRVIMDRFWAHEVPLPALSEQHRIVDILSQADALRKQRAEANTKLQQVIPTLFVHLFGDPSTNPMGWEVKPLFKCFDIVGGGTPLKSNKKFWQGGISWASPKDIKSDIIEDTEDHITQEAINESATRIVPPNTSLIVFRSGILAHSFPVALTGKAMALNQDLKALLPIDKLPSSFIFGWIKAATTPVMSCIKKGATVHNVDSEKFKCLPIFQPKNELLLDFDRRLNAHLELKKKTINRGNEIQTLWEVLLHDAFTGSLTASWREGRMRELLQEMEQQSKLLSGDHLG